MTVPERDTRGIPFVHRYAPSDGASGRVRVYRNLNRKAAAHTSAIYSIQSLEPQRRVVAHAGTVVLSDVKFIVSQKGNARVRNEQRKTVHAFVEGLPTAADVTHIEMRKAYYNPYTTTTFVDSETGQPLETADFVVIDDAGVRYFKSK